MLGKRISVPVGGVVAASAAVVLLVSPLPGATAGIAPATAKPAAMRPAPLYVFRVAAHTKADAQTLLRTGFDVVETRDAGDLFVLGQGEVRDRLRGAGFTATVERVLPAPTWIPPARRTSNARVPGDENETYYGGYPTVNAQYAHVDRIAAQHADLATALTYGQSWRKQQGMPDGYDLQAICITKKQQGDCERRTDSTKPKFFLMSQIHAREITTGIISWRWIDYLVDGYGQDPDVTALLDSTEVWVVPVANPDGVDIVQQGGDSPRLQRKNADNSHGGDCGASATHQIGVDLNRNSNSHWNTSGTSPDPCTQTFPGSGGDSEVETSDLERLFNDLYPAARGPEDTDPAPPNTRGLMITMHSYADMVLFPWGFDARVHTGNDASLRAIAKRMAEYTGYQYGQPGEILYDSSGGTDDWIYDKLGVASFTIEIGPRDGECAGFLPAYSCQDSFFWPKLRPTLLYAAQQAAAPYQNS